MRQGARIGRLPQMVSLALALCMTFSFVVAPAAIAAHTKGPQPPRPHSLWMPPTLVKKMKTQAQHSAAMQRRAQKPGFPYRQATAARVLKPLPRLTMPKPLTLLNDAAELAYPVPDAQAAAWHHELTTSHPGAARAARLHLWLGEWQLAHNQQPETAFRHFQAAQRLTQPADPLYGLAAYDRAWTFYTEGAYADATTAFGHVLACTPCLTGFSRRDAMLWMRHAGACAGYHLDRERAGIPEPPRLDPLCGVASLASSLRALGRPYDAKTLRAAVHMTGEGSNIDDLVTGTRALGMNARKVRADDQGLILLPKPLVAYVEHDHFVSVVRADKSGVSYLCSDCGPWPGGRVNLTWRQWHLLEGGLYVAVTRPGSPSDRLLSALDPRKDTPAENNLLPAIRPSLSQAPAAALSLQPFRAASSPAVSPVRLAFAGSLANLHLSLHSFAPPFSTAHLDVLSGRLSSLRDHVVMEQLPGGAYCGGKNTSPHCLPFTCCLTGGPGGPGGPGVPGGPPKGPPKESQSSATSGPTSGDPVNLATGEEEYSPKPDIEVYNPHGPSVTWKRIYNSARRAGQGFVEPGDAVGDFDYEMNDFGEGWSTPYNVGVSDTSPGYTGAGYSKSLLLENGARIQFVVPSSPSAATPQVLCQLTQGGQPLSGIPILIYANYAATGNYYSVVWSDRTQWVTAAAANVTNGYGGNSVVYPLGQIVDRNGHAITFHYGPAAGGTIDGAAFAWPLLSSITNENGTALLTVVRVRDGSGNIAAVSDCYGRSVLYHVSTYANHSGASPGGYVLFSGLDHVSQLVPTGSGSAPDRYVYGYQNYSYGWPFLHTISVPNPNGSATPSMATINYDGPGQSVSSVLDANGNTTSFASVEVSGTTGGGGAPGSSSAPSGTLTVTTPNTPTSTNYTQVTVSGNNTTYSYVGGSDMNMSGALVTDGAGQVTMSKTFSATSPNPFQPTSMSDGNGNVTSYVWDQYGNLQQKTSPRGTVTTNTYSYQNFALGELVSAQEGSKTATTYSYYEPSGLVQTLNAPLPGTVGAGQTVPTSYTYDGYGNPLTVTMPGNNAAATIITTYAYGSAQAIDQPLTVTDNLGKSRHIYYDQQGNHLGETDAIGNETDVSYNIANQPVQTTFPATGQQGPGRSNSLNAYLYPGGPLLNVTTNDESGAAIRQVSYTYGQEGESLALTGSTEPVTYAYDALYRLSTLADGNGNTTRYFYNAASYLYQVVYPGAGATSSPLAAGTRDTITYNRYDLNGNVKSRVDGNAVTTNYTYNDPESLLITTHYLYPNNYTGSVIGDTTFGYDQYGRRVTMTDPTGSKNYSYDDHDCSTSVATTYDGLPTKTISYVYYQDGSLQRMDTPAGSFSYWYDADGRMTSQKNPFQETSSWQYLDNDWSWKQTLGNGLVTSYSYNSRAQMVDLTNIQADGTLLSEFAVQNMGGYDGAGNRTSLTSTIPGAPATYSGTTFFAYDQKNQLLQEQSQRNGGYTNTNNYDTAGNPTTLRNQLNMFDADNQNTANHYDGNGNPTDRLGSLMTFDPENRLTTIGSQTILGYNGDGLRAWKQNTGTRTYFLYDGTDPVCELDTSGNVIATNTFGAEGIVSRNSSGSTVFYAFDLQGNVVQRMDTNANVLSTNTYDANGSRISTDNNVEPWTYNAQWGYYTDAEIGIQLLIHRYYDQRLGQFLTRDPISYEGGVNIYSYVQNNPTDRTDPSGLIGMPPAYGRYCGPQTFVPPPGSRSANPVLDQCCKEHDACWGRHNCKLSTGFVCPSPPCQECNQHLCWCTNNVHCSTWDWKCKAIVNFIRNQWCPDGGSSPPLPGY